MRLRDQRGVWPDYSHDGWGNCAIGTTINEVLLEDEEIIIARMHRIHLYRTTTRWAENRPTFSTHGSRKAERIYYTNKRITWSQEDLRSYTEPQRVDFYFLPLEIVDLIVLCPAEQSSIFSILKSVLRGQWMIKIMSPVDLIYIVNESRQEAEEIMMLLRELLPTVAVKRRWKN